MGQTLVTQSTKIAAIVKEIKELTLIKAADVTSRISDIPAVEFSYRQLQVILKVYRQERYTNTNVGGKGITTEVLQAELDKAINNQISGTKLPEPEKKSNAKKAKKPASKPLSAKPLSRKPANSNKYVYMVKATSKIDNLDYYWNCHDMVNGQKGAFLFKSNKEATINMICSGLALAPTWTNLRVVRARKKTA